jgi:hypothetical protein
MSAYNRLTQQDFVDETAMRNTTPKEPQLDNRMLIRDVVVFQFKLIVDGLRDFVLVPVALLAGLLSLVTSEKGKPGAQFYQLLDTGKKSEHWIDLFGALRHAPPDLVDRVHFPDANMDEILDRFENFMVDEEKRGGVTAQARERFEKALRGFKDSRHSHTSGGAD